MSETAIAAAPIVSALSPFVNAAASGLVIGVGGLLFAGLARWTGIAFTPDVQAELEKAADAEVHALIAGAENNLATGKFSVGNPLVATATTALIANAPEIVAKLGLNEAEVRDTVVKAIGRAQKAMTASPATRPERRSADKSSARPSARTTDGRNPRGKSTCPVLVPSSATFRQR